MALSEIKVNESSVVTIDDEILNNKNLITNQTIYKLNYINQKQCESDAELNIGDSNGNVIVQFSEGNIKTKKFDSTDKSIHNYFDNSDAELNIGDSSGNVIVQFSEGNIKTKNFDSTDVFLNESQNWTGKYVSIIGDSISTYSGFIPSGYATWYPADNVNNVLKTWWKQLLDKTNGTLLKNCSWSGSRVCEGDSESTSSAAGAYSTKRIMDLSDGTNIPDIILVYIGINDFTSNVPLGDWSKGDLIESGVITTFKSGYACMINKILKYYPHAKIIVITPLPYAIPTSYGQELIYPNKKNGLGLVPRNYSEAIIDVCNALGVKVIENEKCGIHTYTMWDTLVYTPGELLHPNENGMILIYKNIYKSLITI